MHRGATITISAKTCVTASELIGLLLASYGLIRESFASLAQPRPYGEGRFGEGPYGGAPPHWATPFVTVATRVGLLPRDGTLTLTDRRRNAALAILGTVIAVLALVVDLGMSLAE